MAKDHLLPRYLLRIAVCVCVLLGGCLLVVSDRWLMDGHGMRTTRIGLINTDFPTDEVAQIALQELYAAAKPAFDPLREIYTAEIGVKEATGNNDGSRVGAYLRYCGLDEGHAWCAAFVSWCYGQAGYTEPRNAWSPALFPSNRTIWHTGDRLPASGSLPSPRAGDVFGIYYTNLKRIAHVGFVDGWDGKYCTTVEGNTGPDGAVDEIDNAANPIRAGPIDGVYRKRRPIRTIHAVARWAE